MDLSGGGTESSHANAPLSDAQCRRHQRVLPEGLPAQFPSGEAAVTHIKRFCFVASRRVCRLERAKSGGNRKLLVCASGTRRDNEANADLTNVETTVRRCPWFVSVSKSRKPNDRGWKVRDWCVDHSAECDAAVSTASPSTAQSAFATHTPDAKTIAHTLLLASASGGIHGATDSMRPAKAETEMSAKALKAHIKVTLDIDVRTRTLYRIKDQMLHVHDDTHSSPSSACAGLASSRFSSTSSQSAVGQHHRGRTSFQWIESLLQQFRLLNPDSVAELFTDADNCFQRAILMPKPHIDAVVMNSSLLNVWTIETLTLDAELRNQWFNGGTIVSIIARDGNDQELVLAHAILAESDKASYQWILAKLHAAGVISTVQLSSLSEESQGQSSRGLSATLVFCDCSPESALAEALSDYFPTENVVYALEHLMRYMLREKLILETDEVALVKQAHATESMDEFRAILSNLRLYRPSAASFLESLDPRTWAFCANLDRPWYGQQLDLSSAVDAPNDGPMPTPDSARMVITETPCRYLYECMNAMMKNLFERSANAKKWTEAAEEITPYAKQLLDQEANLVEQYEVLPCNAEIVAPSDAKSAFTRENMHVHDIPPVSNPLSPHPCSAYVRGKPRRRFVGARVFRSLLFGFVVRSNVSRQIHPDPAGRRPRGESYDLASAKSATSSIWSFKQQTEAIEWQ
ncbi:hypothetical protein FI667_g8582, partial [Globisporangium splendens]